MDGAAGRTTYTQWLNEGGTLEADLTVTKLEPGFTGVAGDQAYLVVASDTAHRHALTWLRRHTPADAHCVATDVTSAYAQVNIQGPRSRELLQRLVATDLSNAAFPFRTAREVDLGFARVLASASPTWGSWGTSCTSRPAGRARLRPPRGGRGRDLGLRPAGLKALSSLRMEKGYRDYGHDIDNTDSAHEAGLGFAVALDKPFVGRDACARFEGPRGRPGGGWCRCC